MVKTRPAREPASAPFPESAPDPVATPGEDPARAPFAVRVPDADDVPAEVKVWVVREKGADIDEEGFDHEREEGTDAADTGTGHVDALADD